MLETGGFLSSLNAYKKDTIGTLEDNLKTVCNNLLEKSKEEAPIDIGTLRENSGIYVVNDVSKIIGYIGYMEFYAVYVHQGTGIFALNGDGRKTPWWWQGTTEKWQGWHLTSGQKPKQFLWDVLVTNVESIPEELKEGL